jgi:hypothetical protein
MGRSRFNVKSMVTRPVTAIEDHHLVGLSPKHFGCAAPTLAPLPDSMDSSANLNWIANFIWGIADDVLRDLYKRGESGRSSCR